MKTRNDVKVHYCPACGHTVIHGIMAKLIDEMDLREKTIISAPVGCSVLLYNYFNLDTIECAHGRVPNVLTAIKRLKPECFVLGYQGDGDLAAIGTNETIHTANRGENITIIFVNNAIYGMTGGQMAPTTLPDQITTTTPRGRDNKMEGAPLKMCEILSNLEGPTYIERVSVHSAKNVEKTRQALKKAFECQINNKGYSFIEILSMCPVGWRTSPVDSIKFVENMTNYFPLKIYKDVRDKR